jgi:hypothetical protein
MVLQMFVGNRDSVMLLIDREKKKGNNTKNKKV